MLCQRDNKGTARPFANQERTSSPPARSAVLGFSRYLCLSPPQGVTGQDTAPCRVRTLRYPKYVCFQRLRVSSSAKPIEAFYLIVKIAEF